MLRSLVLATLASTAAGAGVLGGPLPPLPLLSAPDALTVTIERSGHPEADGTWELRCDDKPGGTHPAAEHACRRLEEHAKSGANPFAPVPADAVCAQVYGGDVTAHITGTWLGRRVDARFSRANGCEIDRWENLEPVLPGVRG